MSALEQAPGIRWWLNTDQVQGYVHGVFEGGGAKGVLYAGALEAVCCSRFIRRGYYGRNDRGGYESVRHWSRNGTGPEDHGHAYQAQRRAPHPLGHRLPGSGWSPELAPDRALRPSEYCRGDR